MGKMVQPHPATGQLALRFDTKSLETLIILPDRSSSAPSGGNSGPKELSVAEPSGLAGAESGHAEGQRLRARVGGGGPDDLGPAANDACAMPLRRHEPGAAHVALGFRASQSSG